MLKYSIKYALYPFQKIWGDIVAGFLTYLIAIFVYQFDLLKMKSKFDSEFIRAFIYYILVLLIWFILRFFYGLVKYKINGDELSIEPEERLVPRPKLINGLWIEYPIQVRIRNNSDYEIKECCATIIDLEQLIGKDKKPINDNRRREILKKLEFKDISPRLNWSYRNIANKNCGMNIQQKSDGLMLEIARYRMSIKNQFEGKIINESYLAFEFCGNDEKLISEIGLYKVKLKIDYYFKDEFQTKYFDGYFYIDLEEEKDSEQGFYILFKFRTGNPLIDEQIKEIYGINQKA